MKLFKKRYRIVNEHTLYGHVYGYRVQVKCGIFPWVNVGPFHSSIESAEKYAERIRNKVVKTLN